LNSARLLSSAGSWNLALCRVKQSSPDGLSHRRRWQRHRTALSLIKSPCRGAPPCLILAPYRGLSACLAGSDIRPRTGQWIGLPGRRTQGEHIPVALPPATMAQPFRAGLFYSALNPNTRNRQCSKNARSSILIRLRHRRQVSAAKPDKTFLRLLRLLAATSGFYLAAW